MMESVLSVLIIEDEPVLAKNIATYLRRYGYEVRTALSAEAGLVELEYFKPDAILLDFNLPAGMNGLEALARIREVDRNIKVIMMTAYSSDELAAKATLAGACQFITKPVSVSHLKAILEAAVSDNPPGNPQF